MSKTRQLVSKIGRRSFLKMSALAASVGATGGYASSVLREATEEEIKNPYEGSIRKKSICTSCSVGCGINAEIHKGVWVRHDIAVDHPISWGGHCCKGADMLDLVRSAVRLKYPMVKEKGQWKRISWEEAYSRISKKLLELHKEHSADSVQFLGSAKMSTEQAYYFRKFCAFFGTNNTDHQARI